MIEIIDLLEKHNRCSKDIRGLNISWGVSQFDYKTLIDWYALTQ